MTKRPIDWTDEELEKAVNPCANGILRKMMTIIGAVHPAEAREREREAAEAYASCSWPVGEVGAASIRRAIDRDYPSLLPKSFPPLVLSTGVKVERTGQATFRITLADGRENWGNTLASVGAFCATPADFANVAKLAEYGSEEEKR